MNFVGCKIDLLASKEENHKADQINGLLLHLTSRSYPRILVHIPEAEDGVGMVALVRKHLPVRYVSESNSDATCNLRVVMAVSELFTIDKGHMYPLGESSVYLNVFATKRDFVSSTEIRESRTIPLSYPVGRVKIIVSHRLPCLHRYQREV